MNDITHATDSQNLLELMARAERDNPEGGKFNGTHTHGDKPTLIRPGLPGLDDRITYETDDMKQLVDSGYVHQSGASRGNHNYWLSDAGRQSARI